MIGAGGNYISKYDFECENDDFFSEERKDFKNEVIVKYFKTNTNIYKVISNINKPRHYKEGNKYYIELCSGLLHKSYKPLTKKSKNPFK
jgi:hypothetical protein